ncbi:82bd76e8-28af-4d56-ad79-2a61f42719ba [Thermothielavioides terrestris]|uniref:Uncharacterized protein n=2 Tax=Thermothielavioides terrestris TaxID=2587410 RepID=G2RDS9_THETT|nr:uncharacterized protein THITE_73555 [Thermothielavioides terrestris NRRL 8126]AEO70010.1 hypothetical protein THITE_73555 [Thermothielavioides terrestris NRRL 8126]SPQ17805.1 82bd76e8-28af-4d56-ad79-2a61f42719ba [Thermothielavioides terrestris]
MGSYVILRRPWRAKKPLYFGMIPELGGTIALLVLFGLQNPDAFRTLFWRIGFEHGLNSNPNMILYAYANFRPLPSIPFVWSQTLTSFNVAISILSLFVLLAKMIATIMKVFYPVFGVFVGLSLTALYATSVGGQAGPDYADPRYPSPVPWYIRMGCDIAAPYNAVGDCKIAKGAFAATVFMMTLYLCQTAFAIWSMLPNKELDRVESDDEEDGSVRKDKASSSVEMKSSSAPNPQATPFTPRTQAFHTLDRKLPLRDS